MMTRMVRAFYQQLRMNYPVAIGAAKLAEQYGGVLGLPVTFLIGRDGPISVKHTGVTEVSLIERAWFGVRIPAGPPSLLNQLDFLSQIETSTAASEALG